MIYRRFGKTNIDLSVITCGCMRFQYQWQDAPWDEIPVEGQKNIEKIIELALEKGINHIETARGYGTSEMQLGAIFKHFDKETRKKVHIQTKISATPLSAIEEKFEKSWNYLNLEYIDFLSVHCLNNERSNENELDVESMLAPGGFLEKAQAWKKEGRVRHIGFSTHANPDVIVPLIKTGIFSYVNLLWGYIHQVNTEAIVEAKKQDMGVFIISPVARAGLLHTPPKIWEELCKPYSAMQFNMLYTLLYSDTDTVSVGAAKPEELDYHINTVELLQGAKKKIEVIHQALYDEICSRLGKEWVDHWQEGLPTCDQTPNNINVHEILRIWTVCKGWDFLDFAKERYNMLHNAGIFLRGNAYSKVDETEMLYALKNSRFSKKIPEILREAHTMFFDEESDLKPKSQRE